MAPSTNFVEGKTSRSLKAAFLCFREDLVPGVGHLDGGIVAWCASVLPPVLRSLLCMYKTCRKCTRCPWCMLDSHCHVLQRLSHVRHDAGS